jgi:hypothetical protein
VAFVQFRCSAVITKEGCPEINLCAFFVHFCLINYFYAAELKIKETTAFLVKTFNEKPAEG